LPALAAAGVRHLRIRSLRHFYASAQIALGTNIKYISTQLGHASVMITAIGTVTCSPTSTAWQPGA
jgi:integrase